MSSLLDSACWRRVMGSLGSSLIAVLLLAPTAHAQGVIPRVINGTAAPTHAAASVAIETSDSYCTAGLWKPRILITAAHCVSEEGKGDSVIAPSTLTIYPPGANRAAGPSPVKVTGVIVDPQWQGAERDIAFLILSAPLGTPIITRMATPQEVVSLTKAGATIDYVGYGLTGPSADANSKVSDVPLGVSEPLDLESTRGGIGAFETVGDGQRGTCQGDSGGPYMTQVGTELLYLGPLSAGGGPPCDDPKDYASEVGAVASANVDLIAKALEAAGETADSADSAAVAARTCTNIPGSKSQCVTGTAWTYDMCWQAPKATLQRMVSGAWQRVSNMTAKRNGDCPKRYPFNVVFRGDESAGTARFRVVLPRQPGLKGGGSETFTVTHPA